MKILGISLTALYAIFAAMGIGSLFTDKASLAGIIISILYIAVGLAINNRGGKIAKYLAFLTAGIFSLFLLGTMYIVISPFFGERFDLMLLIISSIFGLIGVATIYFLAKNKNVVHVAEST